jgi:photosystem II stability/assembly factor-like uncharacterized protein
MHWRNSGRGLEGSPSPVTAIAVVASAPNVVYAERSYEHLYRSSDSGASWGEIAGISDAFPYDYIGPLTVDPGSPATAYLLNGEVSGGSFISKSTDSGESWTNLATPSLPKALAVDPSSSATLLLATECAGLHRSTDGGSTWSPESAAGIPSFVFIESVAFDPAISLGVIVGTSQGTYWSIDGGMSFLPSSGTPDGLGDFAFGRAGASSVVYQRIPGGLLESTDGGQSWDSVLRGQPRQEFNAIAVDPNDASKLFAGTRTDPYANTAISRGLLRSSDGGRSWAESNAGIGLSLVAISALASGVAGELWAAVTGGAVYRSADGGSTWAATAPLDRHTPAYVTDLAAVRGTAGNVLAVTVTGIYKTADSGASWELRGTAALPISRVVVDTRDPEIIYGFSTSGLFRTTNGGATWARIQIGTPENLGVESLAIASGASSVIYAANGIVYKSTDAGASWIDTTSASIPVEVATVATDPEDPSTIYAGWSSASTACPSSRITGTETAFSGVYKSTDAGAHWSAADTQRTQNLEVLDIAVDPTNPARLLAATDEPCFPVGDAILSLDGGGNWRSSDTGIEGQFVFHPVADSGSGRFYVATFTGVFVNPPLSAVEPRPPRPPSPVRGR